jgi:NADH:ubiquinone oxidoreductase subunit 3 (subunit A)
VANYLIPGFLIALLPVDLVAGLAKGTFPTQATLMVLGGAVIGLYLARHLWGGRAKELESLSRLQLVGQQGPQFDPQSDEAQIQQEDSRVNYYLGAGLLTFGILFNICFILSYLFVSPVAVTPTTLGQAVQLAMLLVFTFLVVAVEAFGAKVFLKR